MRPGPAVLTCFGVRADPVLLPGGQGTTWRAGEIVLKPAEDPRLARWLAEVHQRLGARAGQDFRVPAPVQAVTSGPRDPAAARADEDTSQGRPDWVGDDVSRGRPDWVAADPGTGTWAAWRWLPGEPADWSGRPPCWPHLVAASRAFHAALAGLAAPSWLGSDGSPWTRADQVAWGERDPGGILAAAPPDLASQLRRLLAALRPVSLPAQLVHGDLTGNMLFAAGEPPAVIDFSPYWRPAGLALAVAAVDALTWHGADPAILDELAAEPQIGQLLARAHVGRLVTEFIHRTSPAGRDGLATVERTARPVTSLLLQRLALG